MIKVKTEKEIELIRGVCQVVGRVLRHLSDLLHPGVSTEELDTEAERLLRKLGAIPAFKGYQDYPASICASINEEVVHGIPAKGRRLKAGDIISLDVGAKLNGYFGDAAWTFGVEKISPSAQRLLNVGRQALTRGINKACCGNHLLDISHAIQSYVEPFGFSIVKQFVGHGIGSQLHEDPEIPNFGPPGGGPILKAAMVLAIEPMVNQGDFEVEILDDKWTAVTKDRKLSAHFEHTICVTKDKAEILTAW